MAARQKPARFTLEFPGDIEIKQRIRTKMQQVREIIVQQSGCTANHTDILETCLDAFLTQPQQPTALNLNTYVDVTRENSNQKLFITAEPSLQKCIQAAEMHARHCDCSLSVTNMEYKGHAVITKIGCNKKGAGGHQFRWSSSPYLPNGEYLVNHRFIHGYTCSGILPVQYKRLSQGAGIGMVSEHRRTQIVNNLSRHVLSESVESQNQALLEEIASYEDDNEILDIVVDEADGCEETVAIPAHPGIDIATDARHGWRKNAKDSSVVAIGFKSHKVIRIEHITKHDDPISQRHECVGTTRIYNYLENQGTFVNVHAHDSNAAINNMAMERANTNQNDTWHGIKSLKKTLAAVATGPKYKRGSTWHEQLSDKVEPVLTHVRHCMRNCNGSGDVLREKILACLLHYQNNHVECSETARCRTQQNYEPSCIVITQSRALALLEGALKKSAIYAKAGNYCLARDTYYVESFNNVMNVFQDKRIVFSDAQYNMRSHLAVCHWNENVNRGYTSVWQANYLARGQRRQKQKKNYVKATHKYRTNIWNKYMMAVFSEN